MASSVGVESSLAFTVTHSYSQAFVVTVFSTDLVVSGSLLEACKH